MNMIVPCRLGRWLTRMELAMIARNEDEAQGLGGGGQ